MNILLIGRTGQLGGSILKENNAHQIYAPSRTELDVESKDSFQKAMDKYRPDVVINTAAYHNVPQCEQQPQRAFQINCLAIRDLAAICEKTETLLVTFSSDYVFSGEHRVPYKEDDSTTPLQIYGMTRLAGELAALNAAPEQTVIIRTCGLYGLSGASSKGGNFVDQRIVDGQTCTKLEVGNDQVVSPTFAGDLAQAVLKLIEHPQLVPGIYHLVNEGECSWFEFTRAIYDLMNMDVDLQPVDRGGMSGDMRRPLYSVLANTKAQALGVGLPHWRSALKRYLKEKYADRRA